MICTPLLRFCITPFKWPLISLIYFLRRPCLICLPLNFYIIVIRSISICESLVVFVILCFPLLPLRNYNHNRLCVLSWAITLIIEVIYVLICPTKNVIVSLHVIFEETQFPFAYMSSSPISTYDNFTDDIHSSLVHTWANPDLRPLCITFT